MTAQPIAHARARAAAGGGWYERLARFGLVAKGASYALVGVLAIKLALGDGGNATSRQGALRSLAQHPAGKIVLALLAFGFAAYAFWRFAQALATRKGDDKEKWAKRVAYGARGLIYAGLTFSAIKILTASGGQQSQNAKAHQTTAAVLSWPGGRWIVGVAGVCIAAAGAWNAYRGVTRKFAERWRARHMSRTTRTWSCRVGVAGHLARAVVFGLIGIFVVRAAVDYDPQDAIGLDGALQKLAHAAYGPYLLGVTAAGLVCYGVYCLVDARYRDVTAR